MRYNAAAEAVTSDAFEYLLVRPADREALFANHRCRYVILDEVHTYRGSLGANIALLFRRLVEHLKRAKQDWKADDTADGVRFPRLVSVATSATIKSVDESGRSPEEVSQLRDDAVRTFFSTLTGFSPASVKVVGESIRDLEVPKGAGWPKEVVAIDSPDHRDPQAVSRTLARLAGLPEGASTADSVKHAAVLWKLNEPNSPQLVTSSAGSRQFS